MKIIKCKPTSPGRRHVVKIINPELYSGKPYVPLLKKIKRSNGHNNNGHITMRHISNGHKKRYRIIDFKRDKDNILGIVKRIEYDPNRSANIALILYNDGEHRYIIAPKNLKINDKIKSGINIDIKIGNSLPMYNIPIGSIIHNIEIKIGKGGQLARSAGNYASLIAKDNKYVTLRFRSGELRNILSKCRATIGEVGNTEHILKVLGKAGANRWRGIRPTVRGTAMNPIDHPHGGGEGKNFGKHPVSPWGHKTKGKKTRKKNKYSNKYIISTNKNN